MALRLFSSNRLEILARELARILAEPLASPLDPELVLVQSRGMERWISIELARRHGICANIRFPFPNRFVHEIFSLFYDIPEPSPFDPPVLAWRIMKRLPSLVERPGFELIRRYLGDGEDTLRRLQLSHRIADTFDQYLLFRPEMIFRWEKGREAHWQAVMWRDLVKGHEGTHRAALGRALLARIEQSGLEKVEGLPQRISVFGISSLPGFHVRILAALSASVEVNLFLMNPCQEYWGDIVSDREIKRVIDRSRRGKGRGADPPLHLDKGNTLLASMGELGRDFLTLINEFPLEEAEVFEDPGESTLLHCIQSDILNLRERPLPGRPGTRISPDDSSVQIHVCHSPMREIEVLHDRLLHLFEQDPDLIPADILVMTPDIELYSSYIRAVFDLPAEDPRRIPYSIADRGASQERPVLNAYLAILDLHRSRFGASEIMSMLESTAVRERFELSEADLELIRGWIRNTRIRWGIDESDRARRGLPPVGENTWKAGLQRLLLGYALPGNGENLFHGILPYDLIEGDETEVLGRFLEFTDRLFDFVKSLGRPRDLEGWASLLTEQIELFFAAPTAAEERELQIIRNTVSGLADLQHASGFDGETDIRAIRWHIGQALDHTGLGFGFLSRGVTFCAMLPMRSIPFKVICLVGMSSDSYPRQSQPLGFDLISRKPRPGDRSPRRDDRYLFLESLLSARKIFYLSYVGRSTQDNSPMPPSVLVSELIDYIGQGFHSDDPDPAGHLTTLHRMQAFSPQYFQGGATHFSYSRENLSAARALAGPRQKPRPFISGTLTAPSDEWKDVGVERLCRYFRNPARFLLTERLGMSLDQEEEALAEQEDFELKGLARYGLEEFLLSRRMEGKTIRDLLPLLRSTGILPHGRIGECLLEDTVQDVERFVQDLNPYFQDRSLDPLEVHVELSEYRVTGIITGIDPQRLVRYRYAPLRAKDYLSAWINHLLLNILRPQAYPCVTLLAGLEKRKNGPVFSAWEFPPVQGGKELMIRLLDIYLEGLMKPLPFFPETSWSYACGIVLCGKTETDALARARAQWKGSEFNRGEGQDPCYRQCFRHMDPLDGAFETLALRVFEPLMKNMVKIC